MPLSSSVRGAAIGVIVGILLFAAAFAVGIGLACVPDEVVGPAIKAVLSDKRIPTSIEEPDWPSGSKR